MGDDWATRSEKGQVPSRERSVMPMSQHEVEAARVAVMELWVGSSFVRL